MKLTSMLHNGMCCPILMYSIISLVSSACHDPAEYSRLHNSVNNANIISGFMELCVDNYKSNILQLNIKVRSTAADHRISGFSSPFLGANHLSRFILLMNRTS